MIEVISKNILTAPENIVCQQVNCKGVMGAGLALQIKNKYSLVYSEYKKYLKENKYSLGDILNIEVDTDKIISCLFAQDDYGRSKKVYTNYRALEECLIKLNKYAIYNKYSIAIPYGIGCGLANGNWDIVYDMIQRVFKNYNAVIYKNSYVFAWKKQ